MHEIIATVRAWLRDGQQLALATVIETWGSSPRPVGSVMAVRQDLQVVGSVSGGCIESAVIEAAQQTLATGESRVLEFGVANETAWTVGLTCGGKIRVLVELHPACREASRTVWEHLDAAIASDRPAVLLTRWRHPTQPHLLVRLNRTTVGDWGALTAPAITAACDAYRRRQSREIELDGEPVFIATFPRRSHLLIIGAAHITVHLVALAKELGFRSTVIDPRQIFAAPGRFTVPPETLLAEWPESALERIPLNDDTYAVLLSHDPKIDDPALHRLLPAGVAYIGALGSRRTHARRIERLLAAGLPQAQIDRIKSPAGLDIGAVSPAEIALSIVAEIVQIKQARHRSDD